jgi:hypothetical protein
MSLTQGLPGYATTDGGLAQTGFKAPVLAGRVQDSPAGGPIPLASGYICVQSTASITNQVVTTSAATVNSRASFPYIPVTTGQLQGAGAPAYVGVGAALAWNDTSRRLMIWSSGAGDWLNMSSSGTFSSS